MSLNAEQVARSYQLLTGRVLSEADAHRKAGTLHQPAAQGLTHHVLAADLTPALDGNMTQDDRFAITEMDR